MQIIWTILIGLVVGALAKLIMPGKDPGGIIITIVLGIAGALVARLIGRALGWYQTGDTPGIILSIVGAVILLAAYRLAILRRKPGQIFKRGDHSGRSPSDRR